MLNYRRVPNLASSSIQGKQNVYLKIDRVHLIQIYHYEHDYPLVMTNIAMVFRWPIEIDGLLS